MKANELKKGNYVQIKANNIVLDIKLTPWDIYNFDTGHACFEPIPLTEEWLLKLGFKSIDNTCYINGKQWLMQVSDDFVDVKKDEIINEDGTYFDAIGTHSFHENGQMAVNVLCRGNYVCKSPMFVHELQNLYFDLTGNELEIK